MNTDIEAPALLIYADLTGRSVNPSELAILVEEVQTRYLAGDLVIDRRGRVFKLVYSESELVLARLNNGEAPPIDVTEQYSMEDVDALLKSVHCSNPHDLENVRLAIQLFRGATW